ncbi:MAG: type II toxin-antitoxin system VapC family toxin [Planctomycetaceae bacterium]
MIDTDILSEFLKKKNPVVVQKAADYLHQYHQFAISAITRYEVMRGLKEKAASRQLKKFADFCRNAQVCPITDDVLDRASDLWVEARQGGHPGRDPDLIIAATAMEYGRILVTGNTDHFSWIRGLTVENWREP